MKYISFKEIADNCASNREAWAKVRKILRAWVAKRDSDRLFNAAIRDMHRFLDGCGQIDDIEGTYHHIVSEKVNNPRSSFYLYG